MSWISVKDRLPRKYKAVLIYTARGVVTSAGYYGERGGSPCWQCYYDTTRIDEVTHWMPFPKPPQ